MPQATPPFQGRWRNRKEYVTLPAPATRDKPVVGPAGAIARGTHRKEDPQSRAAAAACSESALKAPRRGRSRSAR